MYEGSVETRRSCGGDRGRDRAAGERRRPRSGRHRYAPRQHRRPGRPCHARRRGHHHRDEHEHQLHGDDERERVLHVPKPEGRHVQGGGGAGRVQEGGPRRHHRPGKHNDPRRSQDGGRRSRGINYSRRSEPDPADRPHRYGPYHRIEDGERHAAHLQPEFPEHPDHSAGHDASSP